MTRNLSTGRLTAPTFSQAAYSLVERIAGWAVLAALALFTYALFYQVPYLGFFWRPSNNRIEKVFVQNGLEPDDQLLQVGPVSVDDYRQHLRLPLFPPAQPGETLSLVIQRSDQLLTLPWTLPGRTDAEVQQRLTNQWWLPYIFWAFGQAALLLLRPKDARWRLFIAFNFLTALWLSASSLSQTHLLESAIVLRAAIWLCVPVYWQLHWVVPKPLGQLPRALVAGIYACAVALALAEWFELLPVNAYGIGFVLALAGSILLMAAHFFLRRAERRDIVLLFLSILFAIGLPLILGLFVVSGSSFRNALTALLALPLLPLAYSYAAYHGRLPGLEVRANRLIALYLFFFLVGLALVITVPLIDSWLDFPGDTEVLAILAALLVGVVVAVWLAPFQRWVERRILRVPLPPTYLLETYTARITVSLNEQTLAQLLRDAILPSLLIRQSALLRFNNGVLNPTYAQGIEAHQLPSLPDATQLLADAGAYRSAPDSQPCPWVRLALKLTMENNLLGLWLLGRRDPDDSYSHQDIDVLKSLANQTAIALTNIAQAESLRALYQVDIEHTENQRTHLARELHDHLLNDLARLETSVDEKAVSPEFLATCESLIATVRQIISDLRPDALNYGLYHALQSLVDDLSDRPANGATFRFQVLHHAARHTPPVELHVYRIVQQACENTLKHAGPCALTLRGELSDCCIDLVVEDDGKGFTIGSNVDVAHLAVHKHFGLAGMLERAAIIGAELQIDSAPDRGTRIYIRWPAGSQSSDPLPKGNTV